MNEDYWIKFIGNCRKEINVVFYLTSPTIYFQPNCVNLWIFSRLLSNGIHIYLEYKFTISGCKAIERKLYILHGAEINELLRDVEFNAQCAMEDMKSDFKLTVGYLLFYTGKLYFEISMTFWRKASDTTGIQRFMVQISLTNSTFSFIIQSIN